MRCHRCGKVWSDNDARKNYHFSSSSQKKGSYVSPKIIYDLGEHISTCPADPMPELDAAIHASVGGDPRTGPDDRDEREPSTPRGTPTSTHKPKI